MTNEEMSYEDKYDYLLKIMTENIIIDGQTINLKTDFEKFFVKGNKSAAKRIRKVMQLLRTTATEIRNDVQQYKKGL